MQNIFYFRTLQNGSQETHLSHNCDSGICGIDLFGDSTVHDRQPEQLEGVNHRVTCRGCQQIIATVKAHLTKHAPDAASSSEDQQGE
jgi:hypothetical protein